MTDEPLDWTLRVSVDGAQRLMHAWKDGRLEKTLGFPIESLQIHTPFTPTPGGGGSAPPDDDSRPITLLPWDGLTVAGVVVQASAGRPAGPKGGEPGGGSAARARAPEPAPSTEDVGPSVAPHTRRASGPKRVALALALLAAVLIALWLAGSSPDEPTPETSSPQATSPSAADVRPSSAAGDDSRPSAAGAEGSAAGEEPAAAATTEGADLADPVPQTTEPAALLPRAPAALPAHDPTLGPAGGVASDGKVGPAKPRKGDGGGKPKHKAGVAPKPPKNKALYVHYRCETEGAEFAIVVHARNVGDAKASACGDKGDACITATTCVETHS